MVSTALTVVAAGLHGMPAETRVKVVEP